MASLKDIRKRISTVRSTQQITKAMKMVAAAKLRRAQEAVTAARPYATKLTELLRGVAGTLPDDAHPLLRSTPEPARIRLLVLTSDRGLCGAYNSALLRQAQAFLRGQKGRETSVSIVGRKAADYFRRRQVAIADRFGQTPTPAVALAREIAAKLVTEFKEGKVDRVEILYSLFRSALSQVPTIEPLLPLSVETKPSAEEEAKAASATTEYLMEPDQASLLDRLLPQVVELRIYRALLEAAASEHGARMTAMDSATSNASKMIFSLTLAMNRARQAAITKELMEIVSGAEALKG